MSAIEKHEKKNAQLSRQIKTLTEENEKEKQKVMKYLQENQHLVKCLDSRNSEIQKFMKQQETGSPNKKLAKINKLKAKNIKLEAQMSVLNQKVRNLQDRMQKEKMEVSRIKQDHYEVLH